MGLPDALQSIVHGDLQGAGEVFPIHQGAHTGGGEHIAGAVEAHRELFIEIAGIRVCGGVIGHGADLAGGKADAGEHGGFTAQAGELLQQIPDIGFIVVVPHVVNPQHKGGLSEVGDNNIGFAAQLAHFLGKLRRKASVKYAVVRHSGVHVD